MEDRMRILLCEDDENLGMLLREYLQAKGFNADLFADGESGYKAFLKGKYDICVLDVMMPKKDGWQVCREIREISSKPVIMITAKGEVFDKVLGLELGADDYITKPIDDEEMLLRIKALLRRAKIASERKICIGKIVLDYDSLTVTKNGESQELPQKEFLLLFKLLSYPNKIFTRRKLMDEIWDMDSESDERTVDVHISRLRDRFKGNDDFEIITVRGLGYKAVYRA